VITQDAWEGKSTHRHSHNWPKTTSLSADKWQTCREALRQTILFPHRHDKQLQQPLGRWATAQGNKWLWWFDASQDAIYKKQPHRGNRKWIRSNPHCTSHRHHIEHTLDKVVIPLNCRRCSVQKTIGRDRLCLFSSDQSHLCDNVEEAAMPVAWRSTNILRASPKMQDGPSAGPDVQMVARQSLEHSEQVPSMQLAMDSLKVGLAHQPCA